jgi:ribosomal protein L29
MAHGRAGELRKLSEPELRERLGGARRSLWDARVKAVSGALTQTHQLRLRRRLIARLETLRRQAKRQPEVGG